MNIRQTRSSGGTCELNEMPNNNSGNKGVNQATYEKLKKEKNAVVKEFEDLKRKSEQLMEENLGMKKNNEELMELAETQKDEANKWKDKYNKIKSKLNDKRELIRNFENQVESLNTKVENLVRVKKMLEEKKKMLYNEINAQQQAFIATQVKLGGALYPSSKPEYHASTEYARSRPDKRPYYRSREDNYGYSDRRSRR